MKKILPLKKPEIVHSPFNTYLFAILSNYPETKEWVMKNCINIQIYIEDGTDHFSPKMLWDYCPYTETIKITYGQCLNNWDNFVEFCKECIERESYILPILNMRYIPRYKCEIDSEHNPIIYGFDDESENIYIADFFQNGIFSMETCKYSELNQAFSKLTEVEEFASSFYLGYSSHIILLNYTHDKRQNNCCCNKAIQKAYYKKQLLHFLEGLPTFYEGSPVEIKEKYCFGIKCIDYAIDNNFHSRRFHSLLYSWSRLWVKRIEYLLSEGIIDYNLKVVVLCEKVCKMSKINLYNYLKYDLKTNCTIKNFPSIQKKVILGLKEYRELVYNFIIEVLSLL